MSLAKAVKWNQASNQMVRPIALCAGLFVVSMSNIAQSSQRPLPVVSVSCGSEVELCQALVQTLAERAPSRIYRINPDPIPPQAFDLRLDLSVNGKVRLQWQEDGQGTAVTRAALTASELAETLVEASPGLNQAMGVRR